MPTLERIKSKPIEYQIPRTSKRVDFMIAGADSSNNSNVVVVELKQWDKAEKLIISIAKNEQSSPTYRKDDTHGIDSPHNENPPQHPQV